MKKTLNFIISIFLITVCCTSCFTAMTIASIQKDNRRRIQMGTDLGKEKALLGITTFQKVSPYVALAHTGNGDVVCVIAKYSTYYDGLFMSGWFIRKGTYTYTTITGIHKHVLVYVYKKDLEDLKSVIEQFLKEQPELVTEDEPYITA